MREQQHEDFAICNIQRRWKLSPIASSLLSNSFRPGVIPRGKRRVFSNSFVENAVLGRLNRRRRRVRPWGHTWDLPVCPNKNESNFHIFHPDFHIASPGIITDCFISSLKLCTTQKKMTYVIHTPPFSLSSYSYFRFLHLERYFLQVARLR